MILSKVNRTIFVRRRIRNKEHYTGVGWVSVLKNDSSPGGRVYCMDAMHSQKHLGQIRISLNYMYIYGYQFPGDHVTLAPADFFNGAVIGRFILSKLLLL